MAGWDEAYFSCRDRQRLIDYDVDFYRQRFIEDSPRLFSLETGQLESLRVYRGDPEPKSRLIADTTSLDDDLRDNGNKSEICFYVIRQEYSWGRFRATQELFQKILTFHDVFPPFIDAAHAFGFKIDEDDKVWDGFRASISDIVWEDKSHARFELCYNIRHVEKHGRNSGNPWSLRQVGVYQQVNLHNRKSTWILLQPPDNLYRHLKEVLKGRESTKEIQEQSFMLFHMLILFRTLSNWGDYIDDLRRELTLLDDKACFSRVGLDKANDYPITFADKQKLQLLLQKLLRTLSILDSCSAVAKRLESHCRRLASLGFVTCCNKVIADLESYGFDIECHHRSVANLIQISSGTDGLLSKILEFRNNKVLLRTSLAMQSNLDALNRIAVESADVAEQGRRDSKALKALTLIATMYLPATLLATLFSSNLIQLRPNSNDDVVDTHLYVTTQFWLYVVVTVALTVATMLCVVAMKWRLTNVHVL